MTFWIATKSSRVPFTAFSTLTNFVADSLACRIGNVGTVKQTEFLFGFPSCFSLTLALEWIAFLWLNRKASFAVGYAFCLKRIPRVVEKALAFRIRDRFRCGCQVKRAIN